MRGLGVLREVGAWPVRRWRYASSLVVLALAAGQLGSGPLLTVAVAALAVPGGGGRSVVEPVARLVRGGHSRAVSAVVVAAVGPAELGEPGAGLRLGRTAAGAGGPAAKQPGLAVEPCTQAVGGSSAGHGGHVW